jgi:Uma2 family endonuclease
MLAEAKTRTPVSPPVRAPTRTLAQLKRELGGIPDHRILLDPPPGTATERDLLAYVEGAGREKLPVELFDGTLVAKPTGYIESVVAIYIARMLGNHIEAQRLGWVSGESGPIRLKTQNVRMPDVAFIPRNGPNDKPPIESVSLRWPTLVVEVISKANTAKEIARKRKEYFDSGTLVVWEIDCRKKTARVWRSLIDVDELGPKGTLDASPAVKDFKLKFSQILELVT